MQRPISDDCFNAYMRLWIGMQAHVDTQSIRLYRIKKRFRIVLKTTMVEVLDDGGNAMANAMQSSDIVKDTKKSWIKNLLGGIL